MQQQDYLERLGDVLDSAETLFADKGFHGASMRDVARAAGVSVAGLYYYLPSKQIALYLICERIFDNLEAGTLQLEAIDDPMLRLDRFVREHLRYIVDNHQAYRVLLRDLEVLQGKDRYKLHARRRRYFSIASKLIESVAETAGPTSPRLAAAALFGVLNWAPMWYRPDLDGDVDELAGKVLAIFLHGIAPSSRLLETAS
jgi:TetR/AcrR family transcriptional regulator, cholesterol catabolism regulator